MSRIARRTRTAARVSAGLALALLLCGCVLHLRHMHRAAPADGGMSAVDAAADHTVALLSYTAATVEKQLHEAADALAPSTFRDDFLRTVDEHTIPVAQSNAITTSAQIVGRALVSAGDDRAEVLLFIDQSTSSSATSDSSPTDAGSRVEVTMTRDGGSWRIADFRTI